MKLKILMDNHTEIDVYYLGEPAVSYWIETEGKVFLFDTAYSDAFLKNAIGLDSRQTVEFIFLISEKKKICDFFCIIRKNRYIRPLKRQVFRQ